MTSGISFEIARVLPSLSLNQPVLSPSPSVAMPSTVLSPGKSYSSNLTPSAAQLAHRALHVVREEAAVRGLAAPVAALVEQEAVGRPDLDESARHVALEAAYGEAQRLAVEPDCAVQILHGDRGHDRCDRKAHLHSLPFLMGFLEGIQECSRPVVLGPLWPHPCTADAWEKGPELVRLDTTGADGLCSRHAELFTSPVVTAGAARSTRTAPHQPAPPSPDPTLCVVVCVRHVTACVPAGIATGAPDVHPRRHGRRRPCPRRLRFVRLQPRLTIARSSAAAPAGRGASPAGVTRARPGSQVRAAPD